MKIQRIIALAVVFVALSQCKKASEEPYPNKNIVMDNAQAAVYFHAVFSEAENVWAFIHSQKYEEKSYRDPASTSTSSRVMTYESYNETKNRVTVEYVNWTTNLLSLSGKIEVIFDKDSSYRKDGKMANVMLTDFLINDQKVAGEATLKYRRVGSSNPDVSVNDQYTFALLNGAVIYEKENPTQALISCSISNGQYERIQGNSTLKQDDDEWVYSSGAMTGMLRDDPNLKYTNTVSPSYTQNGQNIDGKVYYTASCKTARQGISLVKITGRPDIRYFYNCLDIDFVSFTDVY